MPRTDVTIAPPIEGQIQWTLGEFVYYVRDIIADHVPLLALPDVKVRLWS